MKKQFKTYQPSLITSNSVTQPSCFNRMCLIREYKVTVEEIEVSKEVLEARLRKLWKEETNFHNKETLQIEANKLGIKLD